MSGLQSYPTAVLMLEWPTGREITTRSMPMSIMLPIRDLRGSCGENLSTPPCFLRLLPILKAPVGVMPTRNILLPLLIGLNKGPLVFTPYGDLIVECPQDIPGQEVRALLLFPFPRSWSTASIRRSPHISIWRVPLGVSQAYRQ